MGKRPQPRSQRGGSGAARGNRADTSNHRQAGVAPSGLQRKTTTGRIFERQAAELDQRIRFGSADVSALKANFRTGLHEESEEEASTEDRDPRYLYADNGDTTCTLPGGTASTTIQNTDCARPCTVRHEAVHRADISSCCAKAGKAHDAAKTAADKTAVEDRFFGWMGNNVSWFECRAYAESVRCADETLTAKSCATGATAADAPCCTTLTAYRRNKEGHRARHCAAATAALTACPFP